MAKKRKKKKWGKIGAPRSAKRRNWMRRMRSAHKGRVLKRTVGGNHIVKKKRKKAKRKKAKRKVKRTRRRFP